MEEEEDDINEGWIRSSTQLFANTCVCAEISSSVLGVLEGGSLWK
jgi:hypothetical protein